MKKIPICLLLATMLSGCEYLEPRDTITKDGPVPSTSNTTQSRAFTLFSDAYEMAYYDEQLIAKGWATPGKVTPTNTLAPPEKPALARYPKTNADAFPVSYAAVKELGYSPLDFCKATQEEQDDAQTAADKANAAVAKAKTDLSTATTTLAAKQQALATATDTTRAAAQSAFDAGMTAMTDAITKLGAASSAATTATALAASTKKDKPKAACTYQSVHARTMAVTGFALVDQNCDDFFRAKGGLQQGIGVTSDLTSTFVSLGAGAVGAATGVAALPSASSFITAFSGGGTSLLNKDLLFGQANIATTQNLVIAALSADTDKALPNPDNSEWTFKRAVESIRTHQNICRVENVLTLIQAGAASSVPKAQAAAPTKATTNPATGAKTVPSGSQAVTATPAAATSP